MSLDAANSRNTGDCSDAAIMSSRLESKEVQIWESPPKSQTRMKLSQDSNPNSRMWSYGVVETRYSFISTVTPIETTGERFAPSLQILKDQLDAETKKYPPSQDAAPACAGNEFCPRCVSLAYESRTRDIDREDWWRGVGLCSPHVSGTGFREPYLEFLSRYCQVRNVGLNLHTSKIMYPQTGPAIAPR